MIKSLGRAGWRHSVANRAAPALAIVCLVAALGWSARQAQGASKNSAQADESAGDAREQAARQLRQTRQLVADARALARTARLELDSLVADHFDQQQRRDQEPVVEIKSEPLPAPEESAASEIEWLAGQLQQLRSERDELLGRLTPAHPQIVELEARIGDLERRFVATGRRTAAGKKATAGPSESKPPAEPRSTDGLDAARDRDAALQYRQAHDRWDSAERGLESALEAEAAAAETIESHSPQPASPAAEGDSEPDDQSTEVRGDTYSSAKSTRERLSSDEPTRSDANRDALTPEVRPNADDETRDVPPDGRRRASSTLGGSTIQSATSGSGEAKPPYKNRRATAENPSRASQPLALVALVVAIIVAALASIRLARHSGDTGFASLEEVGATLSLPVVGVIPSAQGASAAPYRAGTVYGGIKLAIQIVLAVSVFAIVAYAVQSPGSVSRTWAELLDGVLR